MSGMNLRIGALLLPLLALMSSAALHPLSGAPADTKDAFYYNRLLGRGVNLGNALEAPREGEWGVVLQEEYFDRIKRAGFDSVRIPVRWSAHSAAQHPYTIEPAFLKRVDWAVNQALSRGLAVVVNAHHYEESYQDPDGQLPRFKAIWRQLAERYRKKPDRLFFEILNEPHDRLTDERWNELYPQVLAVIRESNPRRMVIVGPGNWNNVERLPHLKLPESDRRLIATFHYYNPFPFTHQGAEWVEGSEKWQGTTWTGTEEQLRALRADFAKAAGWARAQRRPLFLGEFGAYSRADAESRVRWTNAVAREAERHDMAWAYWEFCAGFGVYDPAASRWRAGLLRALLPPK